VTSGKFIWEDDCPAFIQINVDTSSWTLTKDVNSFSYFESALSAQMISDTEPKV
jgi:hypothetical protein